MGIDLQYLVVVRNTFVEVKNAPQWSPRCRAVSEFTGMCQAKEDGLNIISYVVSPDPITAPEQSPAATDNSEERVTAMERDCSADVVVARVNPLTAPHLFSIPEQSPIAGNDNYERVTVMMRNVPNDYNADAVAALIDGHFEGLYDFLYLPIDFRTGVNLGYAFVNLASHLDALRFMEHFQGFCSWACASQKVCEVSWAYPNQGLCENVERYRNSPVMHESVPDMFKPRLFMNGQRVVFPPPTKRIRAPRVRPARRS